MLRKYFILTTSFDSVSTLTTIVDYLLVSRFGFIFEKRFKIQKYKQFSRKIEDGGKVTHDLIKGSFSLWLHMWLFKTSFQQYIDVFILNRLYTVNETAV